MAIALPLPPGRFGRATGFTALFALVWLAAPGCKPESEVSQKAYLALSTGVVSATTTFEVRLDAPAVSLEEVGASEAPSPLRFAPRVAGRFRWLSRRSGVFVPSEPLKLGTRYEICWRSDWRNAAGRPAEVRLRQYVRTPPLEATVMVQSCQPGPAENVSCRLIFNTAVNPGAVEAYSAFVREDGQRVPVVARRAKQWFRSCRWGDREWGFSWEAAFAAARGRTAEVLARPPRNQFIVHPVRPLAPGHHWRLEVGARLPAVGASVRLPLPVICDLSELVPFAWKKLRSPNSLSRGRRLVLEFNRPVADDLSAAQLRQWVRVDPEPAGLEREVDGRKIVIRAADREGFQLGRTYRVTVAAELPSQMEEPLGVTEERTATFLPLKPRVFLPAWQADQMAAGPGVFRVAALNLPKIRVRAKRLNRSQIVHALRGYENYNTIQYHDEWRYLYTRVDYQVMAGVTTMDVTRKLTVSPDHVQTFEFTWPEMLDGGAYGALFLEASRGEVGAQALLQHTDLGLEWKWGNDGRVLARVFSYATARPVRGARVEAVTDEDVLVGEAVTDEQGLATFDLGKDARWLVVSRGEDFHAIKLEAWRTRLSSSRFWRWFSTDDEEKPQVLLFSDRGVYRPGDTLHLAAIARQRVGDALVTRDPFSLPLLILGPGDDIRRTNLVFDARGAASLDLTLPDTKRGCYAIQLGGERWDYPAFLIHVADYRPNPFEITLDVPAQIAPGRSLRVPVRARYLFGAPVSRGQVKWSAEAGDESFAPEGFEGWTFAANECDLSELGFSTCSHSFEGSVSHTAAEPAEIRLSVPFNERAPQPVAIRLRAELTDPGQQTLSRAARVIVHSSDCYVGVRGDADVWAAGETARFELAVVGRDGTPWRRPFPATVRLQQVRWHVMPYVGASGRTAYRNEPYFTNTVEQALTIMPLRDPDTFRTATTRAAFPLTEPGQYLLEVEGRDPAGRRVFTAHSFYVSGHARLAWDYDGTPDLELVPDQREYHVGDTATILVKAPFSGQALVSVERRGVRRAWVTALEGNAPRVRVPLTESDPPNVFVSVTLLRGAEDSPYRVKMPDFRFGVCRLAVSPECHRLRLAVAPSAPKVRPGAPVGVTVTATDAAGRPVPDATLTVFAVDEGVLQLDGYRLPDPLAHFYRDWPLNVRSALSLFRLLSEDPDHWTYGNKGYLVGGGGDVNPPLRKDFAACPLWVGRLSTDAAGRAEVSFTAPDSLTAYRLFAVGHTMKQQFGLGSARFEVRKPLMLQPAVPQFARVGDRLLARAIVHNQTGRARRLTARLVLDATARAADSALLARSLRLAAGASRTVEFPVEITTPGAARWRWELTAAGDHPPAGDRVESRLDIHFPTPPEREVRLAALETGATNLLADFDPRLREGTGRIAVRVSCSPFMHLAESFRQLLHYPYGCVEQTSSSLLPWALIQAVPDLRVLLGKDAARTDAAIAEGFKRYRSMQTSCGGLAYWPHGEEPHEWGSAYAALVLGQLARHDVPVPVELTALLLGHLRDRGQRICEAAAPLSAEERSAHCLGALALAFWRVCPEPLTDALYARRGELNREEQAWLAAALALGNPADERIATLRDARSRGVGSDPFGSERRVIASRLLAFAVSAPGDPRAAALADRLRRSWKNGHWGTTQNNAWAALAMVEYLLRNAPDAGPTAATLRWGRESFDLPLGADQLLQRRTLSFLPGSADWPLRLAVTGARPVYTETVLTGHARKPSLRPLDRGFHLRREYRLEDENGRRRPLDTLAVGDVVLVRLELRADRDADYVVLEDRLPAVLETINLPSQKAARPPKRTSPGGSSDVWPLWADFREYRADRVRFFVNYLESGAYEVTYLARARCAGTALAPSAHVEAMYEPNRRGLSGATRFTCRPTP